MLDNLNAVNWAAITSGVAMLGTILGFMLTVVYRLVALLIVKTTKGYDDRVAGLAESFEKMIAKQAELEAERLRRYDDAMAKQIKDHERLAREFRELMRELPKQYVAREDFLKSVTVLEIKVDRIGENILQMAKEAKR